MTQAGAATLQYDGDGLLASADADGSGSGAPDMLRWDMNTQIPQLALEESPTSTLTRRYISGPQGVLSQTTSAGTFYLHRNALGSTTDLTDSTGTAKRLIDYDPYGQIHTNTALNGGAPVAIQYAGQYRDQIDGTRYYMRNRYYDTTQSRFQTPDPLGEGNQAFTGLYAYVNGQPTALTDPLGLCGVSSWGDLGDCASQAASDTTSFVQANAGTIAYVTIATGGTIACASTPLDGIGAAGCVTAAGAIGNLTGGYINGDRGTQLAADAVVGGAANLVGLGVGRALECAALKAAARCSAGDSEGLSRLRAVLQSERGSIGGDGRLPVPEVPAGMSRSEFGNNVMRWGTGNAAARARIGSLTREELEQAGVTRGMALSWRDFYRNEVSRNPSNPSAAGRADLMNAAARLLQ